MANIDYPTTDHFRPERFEIELRTNCLISASPHTGAVRTYEIPGARWLLRLEYGRVPTALQAEREALFAALGGQANRLTLWHLARPAPRGTLRGSPTLAAAAAVGDGTLSITAAAGETLLRGDMVRAGAQLFQVTEDAAEAAGVLVATVRPRVRAAVASGAAVLWDRPSTNFVLTAPGVSVPYSDVSGEAFMVELAEALL